MALFCCWDVQDSSFSGFDGHASVAINHRRALSRDQTVTSNTQSEIWPQSFFPMVEAFTYTLANLAVTSVSDVVDSLLPTPMPHDEYLFEGAFRDARGFGFKRTVNPWTLHAELLQCKNRSTRPILTLKARGCSYRHIVAIGASARFTSSTEARKTDESLSKALAIATPLRYASASLRAASRSLPPKAGLSIAA